MQRRQLSERRSKQAAWSLIHEVTAKKDRGSNNVVNKQLKCKESLAAVGPLQSVGTRIACMPIHRSCKDVRTSPRKHGCFPCTKQTAHSQPSELPETCAVQPDAISNCEQSVNEACALRHAQAEEPATQKAGESKEVCVEVKTMEKCCRVMGMKKTSSPKAPTDMCSVTLSRLVIPAKTDLSAAIKKEVDIDASSVIPFNADSCLCDIISSVNKTMKNDAVPEDISDNASACDGQNQTYSMPLLPLSIVYPSGEQNDFLSSFGLANKAELPRLQNTARNQLHRDVGGKLRRSVRAQMMHRRSNSMRCMSSENCTDASVVESAARSLHNSRENSPRSLHTPDFSIKKLSSALSKPLKSTAVEKTVNSSCYTAMGTFGNDSQDQQQSSLSILADMALADLDATLMYNTKVSPVHDVMKSSAANSKGFVKSKSMLEWSTSEAVPSRRSARNFNVQRRAWHHLLRANPDEHDPVMAQQASAASSPGREKTTIKTRLPKSHSMKSSSSSFSSDTTSLSQHAGASQKDLAFDRKRTHRKFSTDLDKPSKKRRHSSVPRSVRENSVSAAEPTAVLSQAGITYRFTENGLVHDEQETAPDFSCLSYSYKELECLTPHMCNVCWVNDHMYCRNMKRIASELPNFSGCIHYIACEHFRQSAASIRSPRETCGKNMSLHWTNLQTDEKMSRRAVSADDLFCEENMLDSDSNEGTEGTELLRIQLKARTDQIFRSLGVTELPRCKSPIAPSTLRESPILAEDDDIIDPEQYAAEIVIDANGDCVEDLAEVCRLSNEMLIGDESSWTGICNQSPGYDTAASNTCSLTSFDGSSPHEPPPLNVIVHVRQVNHNRVVINYPKYHLDVTFPYAATDEVVDCYVKNDVARFMSETKSAAAADVPFSVTIVRDHTSSQATVEDSVHAAQSQNRGRQSAVNTAEKKAGELNTEIRPCTSSCELKTETSASVLDGPNERHCCAAEADRSVDRVELLSKLHTIYEETNRLQNDVMKKTRWRDSVADIFVNKYNTEKESQSRLGVLCKEKADLQAQLESLKMKCYRLQTHKASGVQFVKLLDSLLSKETVADLPDKCRSVTRNSLSPSTSVAVVTLGDVPGQLGGMLPLPVTSMNLDVIDSASVASLPCGDSSAAAEPTYTDTTYIQQGHMSVKPACNKLSHPSSSVSQTNSAPLHPTQRYSALLPSANGSVTSVTSGNTTSNARVHQTLAVSERTGTNADSIDSNDILSSCRTSSVGVQSGHFVHLTIPTVLNTTGSNIHIRQFVSIPPHAAGEGLDTEPPRAAHTEVCSPALQPAEASSTSVLSDTMVPSQSVVSFHDQFHTSATSPSHVTSDPLLTKPVSSESLYCHSPLADCCTPPDCYDDESRFDPNGYEISPPDLSLLHDDIIPDIPTPNPSCSSQE